MNAICISAFAAIKPGAGTCVRIVTCCAGPKNADTQLSAASTTYTCQMFVVGISSSASTARTTIARDQRRLERPAIDEDAGDRTDEHNRQHV